MLPHSSAPGTLGGSTKASQREADLMGGKVSMVLPGTLMKYVQLAESEKGSSFSVASYLFSFAVSLKTAVAG